MKTELKRKTTRTVHGDKVVRLRIDIPYAEVKEAERDDQDMLEWLDNNVDSEVSVQIGPFEDDDQAALSSLQAKAEETKGVHPDDLKELDEI